MLITKNTLAAEFAAKTEIRVYFLFQCCIICTYVQFYICCIDTDFIFFRWVRLTGIWCELTKRYPFHYFFSLKLDNSSYIFVQNVRKRTISNFPFLVCLQYIEFCTTVIFWFLSHTTVWRSAQYVLYVLCVYICECKLLFNIFHTEIRVWI